MELNHSSTFVRDNEGVKMTPLMKDKGLFVCQQLAFDQSSKLIEDMLGIEVSDSTLHRLVAQESERVSSITESIKENPSATAVEEQVVYIGIDGSMVPTRGAQWKEAKLARLIGSNNIKDKNQKSNKLEKSDYIALVDNPTKFKYDVETYINNLKCDRSKIIFLTDGAIWIRNWIAEKFPESIHILDYYHVVEHIGKLAKLLPKSKSVNWFENMRSILLEKGGSAALEEIKQLEIKNKLAAIEQNKLINYLTENLTRTNYPEYDNMGYYIGSGMVEAAHRTLLQQRIKLAGQRWKIDGVQKVINLRIVNKTQNWHQLRLKLRTAS